MTRDAVVFPVNAKEVIRTGTYRQTALGRLTSTLSAEEEAGRPQCRAAAAASISPSHSGTITAIISYVRKVYLLPCLAESDRKSPTRREKERAIERENGPHAV